MRLAVLACAVMALVLFGCLEPEPEQPPNEFVQLNGTNQSNQTVTIVVGPQQNQTMGGNTTTPPAPGPEQPAIPEYEETPNATLGVYFIDVGSEGLHGNAVLIKKGGMTVLVDAGPAENAGRVVDFLTAKGVGEIELLISTTADPRDYGGINAVADHARVESFWWNGETFDDPAYAAIVSRMASAPGGSAIVGRGNVTVLNGVKLEVLNPPPARFSDRNNDAIVLRVSDRNFSVLLTSNVQTGAQGRLISEQGNQIRTQVLQAPYYGVGAGTGQIGIFLINAKPQTVIITGSSDESAANGGSRDPFKTLMGQYNISWYENYANGTLRITSDGSSYSVQLANGT